MGVLCVTLAANGLVWIWLSYEDHKASLVRTQREQAEAAAAKIGQFVKEIEAHLGWMMQMPWSAVTPEARRFDALRLLRLAPAITELAMLDEAGREQLRLSRLALDVIGSGIDRSTEPLFVEASANKVFYGPVYLHRGSEPYMTLALTGPRGDAGVAVAKVNLKLIWDVVSQIKVGRSGEAYVVDISGRLIAHPDISLVLGNSDWSRLDQVRATRNGAADTRAVTTANDALGRPVLGAYAVIAPVGWLVFVELPVAEAFEPLYKTLLATGIVLLGGLIMAVLASLFLVRNMVAPIQALRTGAARIGAGALDHRIEIKTGDELEALGNQFNLMASQLQGWYATLERKVEERTHQLEVANLSKSRFLAAASHDLRQPLHALNLFAAQLRSEPDQAERERLAVRIDAAVANMNELFNALLDISKLDAGVVRPGISDFPIDLILKRIEATFAAAAREKHLNLRVVTSSAWARSDVILLERILLNLVANAVRYTEQGGVVVGCRRDGDRLRIEVCDSGIGIPENQHRNVFGEFFQVAASEQTRSDGLGLGLAIVERLCGLLNYPIGLASRLGKGSRFFVSVPVAPTPAEAIEPVVSAAVVIDPIRGGSIVVIDDDAMVREGTRGLLQSWGCHVVTAKSGSEALANLGSKSPDLIISDFHLTDGRTGVEAIALLRSTFSKQIPALLISGDISPARLQEANDCGHHLLHKPVSPVTLRAMMTRLLKCAGMLRLAAQQPAFELSPIHQ